MVASDPQSIHKTVRTTPKLASLDNTYLSVGLKLIDTKQQVPFIFVHHIVYELYVLHVRRITVLGISATIWHPLAQHIFLWSSISCISSRQLFFVVLFKL